MRVLIMRPQILHTSAPSPNVRTQSNPEGVPDGRGPEAVHDDINPVPYGGRRSMVGGAMKQISVSAAPRLRGE